MGDESKSDLYIGLMSGTSMDGIDAALVAFEKSGLRVVAALTHDIPTDLRNELAALCTPGNNEIERLGQADVQLAHAFSAAVAALLKKTNTEKSAVTAIGSHGQTVRHRPQPPTPYSLQIGDPNVIAHLTGITTVGDFRRADIAAGGQGAPLVPAFHSHQFQHRDIARVIVNIGGIANITVLPATTGGQSVIGYDTGPGNILLNQWVQRQLGFSYDQNGDWAATGQVHPTLLQACLTDPYFALPPPKSSGREHFHLGWLAHHLAHIGSHPSSQDVQATLAELTAQTIASAITLSAANSTEVYVCGGGVHNRHLMTRLRQMLAPRLVDSTQSLGIDPDYVEAIAFAWLAKQRIEGRPGNLPAVTGASRKLVLGGVYIG